MSHRTPGFTAVITAALFLGLCGLAPNAADAGCNITIKVKNKKSDIMLSLKKSEVKRKAAPARKLCKGTSIWKCGNLDPWIKKGDLGTINYEAIGGCSKPRRYKLVATCKTGSEKPSQPKTHFVPKDPNKFTKSNTVDFGDISKDCK